MIAVMGIGINHPWADDFEALHKGVKFVCSDDPMVQKIFTAALNCDVAALEAVREHVFPGAWISNSTPGMSGYPVSLIDVALYTNVSGEYKNLEQLEKTDRTVLWLLERIEELGALQQEKRLKQENPDNQEKKGVASYRNFSAHASLPMALMSMLCQKSALKLLDADADSDLYDCPVLNEFIGIMGNVQSDLSKTSKIEISQPMKSFQIIPGSNVLLSSYSDKKNKVEIFHHAMVSSISARQARIALSEIKKLECNDNNAVKNKINMICRNI